jgi:hypothetical protein
MGCTVPSKLVLLTSAPSPFTSGSRPILFCLRVSRAPLALVLGAAVTTSLQKQTDRSTHQ